MRNENSKLWSKARELIYANKPHAACLFPFPVRSHFVRGKSGGRRGLVRKRGRDKKLIFFKIPSNLLPQLQFPDSQL